MATPDDLEDDLDGLLDVPESIDLATTRPGKVVDLTVSDADDFSEEDQSDDEVQVSAVVAAPAKRILPFSVQDQKRARVDEPPVVCTMWGQEFTFKVLDKAKIEAMWTGSGRPSQAAVEIVNSFLKEFGRSKFGGGGGGGAGFSIIGADRFALHLHVYRAFESQLRVRGISTVPIPSRVLTVASMGRESDAMNAELDPVKLEKLGAALPFALFEALRDFQKLGVFWGAFKKMGRCLIADEPGLGKTIQAIGISWVHRAEWPVMVIAPSSARFHWQAEFLKWLKDARGVPCLTEDDVQVVTGRSQPIAPSIKVLVVSYDLVDRIKDNINTAFGGMGFRVIIADECHLLKNQKTKRSKAILPMLKRAKRAILLSGTPALSRPKELWSQLNVIDPVSWPAFNAFTKRYCSGNGGKGASNSYELHLLLRENCMIRRVKKDILKDLPPKTRYDTHAVAACITITCSNLALTPPPPPPHTPPTQSRRFVTVEIEDEALKKDIFDDFREFLTRSGEAASLAKKKSRLMEIALERLGEQSSSRGDGGSDVARGSGVGSARELADQRKSILMQLFKKTGMVGIFTYCGESSMLPGALWVTAIADV